MGVASFWRRRATRHGLVWLLLVAGIGMLAWREPAKAREGVRYSAVLLSVLASAIYAHYWLLTHWLERRRYGRYVLATVGLVLTGALVLQALDHVVKVKMLDAAGHPAPPSNHWGQAAGNVVLALVLATIARYVRRGIVSHYQMQTLRALHLETELSLLKAQVNQHFLFNTLNNLYGLSLTAPGRMPDALLQLAGLMRYQLDSSRQPLVSVGTEAEYLTNYIGLEKLRLRPNTQVDFTADLPFPDRLLAPLLLLPLVENCFKHAIGPSGENVIRITLTQRDDSLTLHTYNSIPPTFRPRPSGLGLPNLRQRLAQAYPGTRHRLTVTAAPDAYIAVLVLYP